MDENWLIADVSPDRALALVNQVDKRPYNPSGPPTGATFLVDFRRKQVLSRWRADELLPKQVRFAELGRTLCAAAGGKGHDVFPVRCLFVALTLTRAK